jgi:hypothetical protein
VTLNPWVKLALPVILWGGLYLAFHKRWLLVVGGIIMAINAALMYANGEFK